MVLKATRSNILRLFWLSHLIDWKYFSFPKRLSLKWKQSCWCNEVYLKASSYFWKGFWRTSKITTLKTGDFYYNILTIILQNDSILKYSKFSCMNQPYGCCFCVKFMHLFLFKFMQQVKNKRHKCSMCNNYQICFS